MSKSLWVIAGMGFLTVTLMVVMMLFSLNAYKGTEAGNRARLSNSLRESFGFPEVGSGVKDVDGRLVLRVTYLAHTDSNADEKFMDAELNRVAAFAKLKYDGRDRKNVVELRVRRLEVQGSGCWQSTLERDVVVDAPFDAVKAPGPEPEPEPETPEEK